jgi:cytochrome c-type biogenesis protein CcmF
MIPELGQLALALALCLAIAQAALGLAGAARGDGVWMDATRPAARGQFVFVATAFGCLTYAFVANDFSVAYVASNSNSALPLPYRVAGVWGGHEGSMLLWLLMLSVWTLAVTLFSRHLPREMLARVLGVMGLVSCGFLLFVLFTSNPFLRLFPSPPDGRDLNPLLQDPGMVAHPPMLYMGYVGFSIAFSFAVAALLSGRLDAAWARWSRPWTTAAWCFLTVGIALGSGWAYYELGWGGWWFWDPVENASFMPWLVGTALIHSLAVTEKRGAFRSWTVLLAIVAFSLSLLGTFLVRSGVLTSVHAFATDPTRGIFILALLVIVIGGSLLLYVWRAPRIGLGGSFEPLSRESLLLANNVIFAAAAGSVLLGTLYPLALDASGLGKISVGPPYFETVFVPLMAPALFLMGVGPLARWKKASLPDLAWRLRWALAAGVVAALVLPFAMGRWGALVALGMLLAAWVAASGVLQLVEKIRNAASGASALARLRSVPRATYGMLLAHFGVAVFVVGVTLVKGYETEKDVRMEPGDTVEAGGYTFRFDGATDVQGPNYVAKRGQIVVTRDGRPVTTLNPEKRIYRVQSMPMTEAAIDPGLTRDLYVSLGEPVGATAWIVRVYHKPFVDWIWGGCLIMALGGALAASDRRYRLAARRAPEQYAAAAAR